MNPRAWSLVPVVALRQAGFPLALMDRHAVPALSDAVSRLLADERAVGSLGARVRQALRQPGARELAAHGAVATVTGMALPFPDEVYDSLVARLPEADAEAVAAYQRGAHLLAEQWASYAARVQEALSDSRRHLLAAFRDDPLLRGVLLLSNDAQYAQFEGWLDAGRRNDAAEVVDDQRGRQRTDLLMRYLQRVATKNETHSHFGPVTAGRVDGAAAGVGFSLATPRRVAFFTHWAAERLAASLSTDPVLFESVRPRRRPWAFRDGDTVTMYAFTTETGFAADWRFECLGDAAIDPAAAWLLDRCDGVRTVAELREAHAEASAAGGPAADRGLDELLRQVVAAGWAVARFEAPIGDPYPLAAIRAQLPAEPEEPAEPAEPAEPTRRAHEVLDFFEDRLARLAVAEHPERVAVVSAMKERFEQVTGEPANRGGGLHYADRTIFFEECHSPLRDFAIGADVARFIAEDLAVLYDMALVGPRLRVRRERDILGGWLEKRFGADRPVPIADFYRRYYLDRDELLASCDEVDRELDELDRRLTALLLPDGTGGSHDREHEVSVSRERLTTFLAGYPAEPGAVCNPDVMIGASSAEALAAGDFFAVIGDCHALREVITHTSFTPLVAADRPELLDEVVARYEAVIDPDEMLCDMARSHPNKTGSQLVFPWPDLEIFGRSAKPRDQVIQPTDLYLVSHDGRAELRVTGTPRRLRMSAPPAGGPSIRQDPLSPFSFPRHFGGVGLRAEHLSHIPRIRCGRVVLHRETWRVPARELRGAVAGGRGGAGDAAELFAANRLREHLGLPRRVFAKVAHEPKPVFVDFAAPMLVRQLARLARNAAGAVQLSEMLPNADQLWLDVEGQRYTTELRCAVFSAGAPR